LYGDGPNGSGKSNICEALLVSSRLVEQASRLKPVQEHQLDLTFLQEAIVSLTTQSQVADKFWRGESDRQMSFDYRLAAGHLSFKIPALISEGRRLHIAQNLKSVKVYHFVSTDMAQATSNGMEASGRGIANSLAQILFDVRAARLDGEGRSQVRTLPTDSLRFQKAMEAYDGELGELWFTNLIGGNP
jgi:hypothetical protein